MTVTISIGELSKLSLTHGPCHLHSKGSLHHFEVAFSNKDLQTTALVDTELEPFLSFREELGRLNRDLKGQAVLRTWEGDLELLAQIDKQGHVLWTGKVGFGFSGGGYGAQAQFWIGDDQTSLPSVLKQLDALIEDARAESVESPS